LSAQNSFQTVAEMVDSQGSIVTGEAVRTAGYWSAGDGGGAAYMISSAPGMAGIDIPVGARWAKIIPENGVVSFRQCGAKGDGITDDRAAIQALLNAIPSKRFHAVTGGGVFKISQYILVRYDTAFTVDLTGTTIIYPSDELTVNGDANALNTSNFARSAFFVRDCHRIKFIGGKYVGSQTPNINNNIGSGVYLYNASFCEVSGFESIGGGSIVSQSQQPNDYGTIVQDGICRSPTHALTVGDMSLVENVYFEQPTTGGASPSYFSHPFYVFAPHKYITLRKCTFKGGDRQSIQVSGSNAPLGRVLIEDCVFINPQGIFYGGDDAGNKRNYHYNITIKDCKAFGQNLSIAAYGIRGLILRDNWFEFSKSYAGSAVVTVERLGATNNSSTLRDAPGTLTIDGNTWALADTARFTFTGSGSVLDIYDTGNRWDSIGTPCLTRITNNRFVGASYGAITVRECANFEVSGNYIGNHKGGIKLEKCAFGKIDGNLFCADTLPGILSDVVDMDNCSFLEIGQNRQISVTKTRKNETGAWYSIEGALNPKQVFNVSSGWAKPTHCKQQAVVFFGASWCDSDSVKIGDASTSKTYRFKAASPGAGRFNSMAGLMSLISADFSTLQCRDFGDSLATVTRAILIEKKTAGTAGQFWAQTFSQHLNAGTHLATNADGRTYSRGGCCCGDKVVAWSPDANPQGGAQLFTKEWKVNETESVTGACVVFDLPALNYTTIAYKL
jgi:hypothetical protein